MLSSDKKKINFMIYLVINQTGFSWISSFLIICMPHACVRRTMNFSDILSYTHTYATVSMKEVLKSVHL